MIKSNCNNYEGKTPSGVEMIDTPIVFRNLTADEIECRVQSQKKDYVQLLLYKNSRVDMNILDEIVGSSPWQREHKEIQGNLYCGIGIQQPSGEWVWKWDCGTESNMEKEKGEASDAFKRAGFNWGIGRELYSAPQIRINLVESDFFKDKLCQSFKVGKIEISSKREITYLSIVDKWGKERFSWGKKRKPLSEKQKGTILKRLLEGEDLWDKLRDNFTFDEPSLRKELGELKENCRS